VREAVASDTLCNQCTGYGTRDSSQLLMNRQIPPEPDGQNCAPEKRYDPRIAKQIPSDAAPLRRLAAGRPSGKAEAVWRSIVLFRSCHNSR
jgi:hypothetical protein